MRVGADIGGTFTDVVAFDAESGSLSLSKVLSTPRSLDEGVVSGVKACVNDFSSVTSVIHGSTVVINSIIERQGARTALVTTRGFRDVYEIGRINRPDSFNPRFRRHRPLIPREMIFEVSERVLADGTVRHALDEAEARDLARLLREEDVEAVAVVFLHAYRFPEHEDRMAEILREANGDWYVTTSHDLSREYREYERTSTTAANAYCGRKVSDYLRLLKESLAADGFHGDLLIMQSNGGLADVETASRQCVQMMESGPAGGVVGTMTLSELLGIEAAVSFDMGGTTAKSCVVRRGEPSFSPDYFVGGYNEGLVIRIPVLEIVEVGTGGGSIGWVDDGGGLHVGPTSAGSEPGPACYGRGGLEPTITDANVVLGRLDATNFLGGEMHLDVAQATKALATRLAAPLGVEIERAAGGMLEIATAEMANAVRAVTLQRGLDPRDFTMFAFGGGGPLHAAAVAKELGIQRVIVPQSPGHFSALGMLMTDLRRDVAETVFRRLGDIQQTELEELFTQLEAEGRAAITHTGVPLERIDIERAADMRYVGQEHSVTVRIPAASSSVGAEWQREIGQLFDAAHQERFSHSAPGQPADIVTLRVSVIGRLKKPETPLIARGSETAPPTAFRGRRIVTFGDLGSIETQVYERAELLAGNVIEGPAVIEETASTTILEPTDRLTVNDYGHLVIEIGTRSIEDELTVADAERSDRTVDAFTAEVIRSGLVSITGEMKTNLMRTAYNQIIYEAEDFTVGLFDRDGNTLSIGLGLPMFIRGLSDSIKAKLAYWSRDEIEPGDILLTNDPDVMGSHLNHMIFTMPVFNDGELVAFSSSMAHWSDVGGVLGGITRDIYSEGIQIPFVKIVKAGVEDAEIISILRMNCRAPERAMGDMRAQMAAIQTGERRLSEMLARYGNRAFSETIELMFEQSERRARAEVAQIPDGTYEAASFMDDDGVVLGKHIPIAVKVIVEGDQMTIDLSGCAPQVAGYFNSGSTAGRSAAEVAFKFLTTPTLYPINDGALRALEIVLPPGRIVSATKPSAMRKWMTVPMTVVDTIFKAIAEACPDRVLAGHHADLNHSGIFAFIDPVTGAFRAGTGGLGINAAGGGWGAKFDEDGMNSTKALNDGDTHNTPVESGESKLPVVVLERSLRTDSGGAGKFRGGLGIRQRQETLAPGIYVSEVERTICAPWGLLGGKAGLPNRVGIVKGGSTERFPTGKVAPTPLEAGDSWIQEFGGGGGFGDPLERDPERVLADVRSGYVSIQSALDDYGVVLTEAAHRIELDVAATRSAREARRTP